MFIFLYLVPLKLSEENLATIVAESSQRFINQNKLSEKPFAWQESASAFSVSIQILIKSVNISLISQSITGIKLLQRI